MGKFEACRRPVGWVCWHIYHYLLPLLDTLGSIPHSAGIRTMVFVVVIFLFSVTTDRHQNQVMSISIKMRLREWENVFISSPPISRFLILLHAKRPTMLHSLQCGIDPLFSHGRIDCTYYASKNKCKVHKAIARHVDPAHSCSEAMDVFRRLKQVHHFTWFRLSFRASCFCLPLLSRLHLSLWVSRTNELDQQEHPGKSAASSMIILFVPYSSRGKRQWWVDLKGNKSDWFGLVARGRRVQCGGPITNYVRGRRKTLQRDLETRISTDISNLKEPNAKSGLGRHRCVQNLLDDGENLGNWSFSVMKNGCSKPTLLLFGLDRG